MSRPTKALWCCAHCSREVSAAGDLDVEGLFSAAVLQIRRSLWPESEDFADTIDASEQLIVTLTGPRRRRHFL